ncbi:copper resistance protein CopC [Kaistia algarum]|uniref:copper resistance CopC/CopD family protein n=1 Tax=Kaistia algarum TaxID=2083279 RepID=UPI000CE7E38D|nr:copper resistance CopC/CopD family protein [Kaistia algarum]MCX5516168.1 copper resistance CopC/CopD family protein [Kaistia algarum]PPE78243.1 copper resistance protein CopC [Kaistia algarum]
MTAIARATRAMLFAALLGIASLLQMQAAFAHASLIGVEPVDGSVIAAAPASFSLSFSEPTSPLSLKLIGPGGAATALDRYALRDATLDIVAPGGLANGTYVLSWRVVSEDGHPVGGSSVFSIGAPSANAPPSEAELVDWPVRIAIWLARLGTYVGLFLGVGGAFFLHWIGGRSRTATYFGTASLSLGLVAVPVSIGLQGLDALGASLSVLSDPIVWKTGFGTSLGSLASLAFAALLCGLLAFRLNGLGGRVISLIGLLLVGAALAASGHASAAHPQWLTRPAVFLHAVGIAFWACALIPLAVAFVSRSADAPMVLRRFSKVVPLAVLSLVAAGLLLGVIQLGSIDALWRTAYGVVFLVKLALLVPLFALAAVNRVWLTTPAEQGDARAVLRLRRSILAEIALVVAIFAVAGAWRFTPPPRALAMAAAAPASIHIHTEKAMADLTITPGRAGPVRASIVVMTGDFGPLDAKAVTLVLSNPSVGIEAIRRPATKPGDGTWHVDELTLPVSGRWTARIDILVSDFDLVKLEDTIDIRP